ncbi:hypothetical protein [Spirosoma endophyticum]|uniref:Colicin import membrane protein n=1 Tax=Spirosoma endophyticum TaxID=662367 RepID=A0A1I2EVP6_9BACT|nr:hypothetical protein [Spirosoma endophyticum]SFE96546.1 colicin import membrane protein [Spirosoma endophyticum]
MKQIGYSLMILWSLWLSIDGLAQSTPPTQKMSVNDRMAKARAAKAEKNALKPMPAVATDQKATSTDYKAPVVKTQKGPHGEVVHTGEKGGKFYINKNGNKTYLSSNQ